MDAFLTTLLSTLLAEMGDRTQILAAALALRFHRNGPILAGLALATLLNSTISAIGGSVIDQWISERPVLLFNGIAYISAGLGMLMWRRKVELLEKWKTGAFMTAFLGLAILQFGDKSQFLIATNAATTPLWGFVLAGGAAGIFLACAPAIILREQLAQILPLQAIRRFGGVVMLLWGLWLALRAFDLVA